MRREERKIGMKNILVIIAMMIMMIIGNISYSEASSFSFNAQADKTEVTPGEEVIVEMSISDIDMGEYGINVVEGILEYDESFFSSMELVNENDWEITYNNEDGERKGKFLTAKMVEGVKEEIIGKIKLKVREDITKGEGQVKIKTIQSNDGENIVDEGERIITIKIKEIEDTPESPDTPDAPQEEPKDEGDKITGTPQNTIQESTKQYEEVENVNTGDNIMVAIGIIAFVVVVNATIVLVKKRTDKNVDNESK